MSNDKPKSQPWSWIPSLYFAEGIPYVVVMTVAVVLYKRMGISNTDIALYTSWLYLPWVIKPLWSPFVDLMRTKRFWILAMQLLIGAGLAGVAFTIPVPNFFQWTLALFWLMAFSSATHDIAADGFYMLGLSEQHQAFFVGIRSTFYRFAMIAGQGLLIMLAGTLERSTGPEVARLEVTAKAGLSATALGNPQSFDVALEGERVQFEKSVLELPLGAADPESVRQLLKRVKTWNQEHGFIPKPIKKKPEPKKGKQEAGFWQSKVSGPLGKWIKESFGEERKAVEKLNGAVAVVELRLSKPELAAEGASLTIERSSGNKNLKLVSSDTLRITPENVGSSALVAVQIDPRQKLPISASFEARAGNIPLAWSITFFVLAGLFLSLFVWHRFAIPKSAADRPTRREEGGSILREFWGTFASFFKRRDIVMVLAFLLFYRFGEAQLVKLAAPFLLDSRDVGGLGLSTGEVGFAYGTVGVLALTVGGILGGLLVSKHGLKRWLLPMVVAINLPNAVYILLAATQTESFFLVNLCIAVEQFGYGFGFTAYMMYMILVAQGPQKTAHFAITTGFMALGMMIPGMFSGWLQEALGYHNFFVWVLIATIPAFIIAALVKIDPSFGRKEA
ncbi:MAG: MFS transporter [Planctomycetota bacterium]|nr:MAG: MFS transporter [Planctomycetota bacterium]